MALSRDGFDDAVRLPPGLTVAHLRGAIDFVEEKAEELIDLYFEQANIFSGVVGILGVRALDSLSPYKKHKHPDVAQQRFPDLSLGGKPDPPPNEALESKGSTRPWAIQSHYDHPGWYVVWRYAIDPTRRMKRGRAVAVWRVDVPFLRRQQIRRGPRGTNTYVWRQESRRSYRWRRYLPGPGGSLVSWKAITGGPARHFVA